MPGSLSLRFRDTFAQKSEKKEVGADDTGVVTGWGCGEGRAPRRSTHARVGKGWVLRELLQGTGGPRAAVGRPPLCVLRAPAVLHVLP